MLLGLAAFYPCFLSYPHHWEGDGESMECQPCCWGVELCIIYFNYYSELVQSEIHAFTKGFFLAHFVQLLPVSSGFDPKPIKPTGGFQFNSKGCESGHLLC